MTEDNLEIEEFPSNSLNAQKKKDDESTKLVIKQVTTGKRIKKNLITTTLKSVGSYILLDILIPAAKNTISDMVNNASDMILFGEPKTRRRDRERSGPRISYTSYYDRDRDRDHFYDRERRDRLYGRSRFDSEEVLLPSREDAEEVLQSMFEIFDQYNAVTVSEFLELVNLPDEYTDRNYGWASLRNVQIRRERNGYIIDLPDPRPLPR